MKRPAFILAWETTQACSLGCLHCRASASLERGKDELSVPEISRVFQQATKIGKGIIIFSGGEPLLRNDLEEAVREAVSAGHNAAISTADGSLLSTERLDSLAKAGVSRFSFSIHFHEPRKHDEFTGRKGVLQSAIEAFNRIKTKKMEFQVNTTILPENYEDLEAMFRKIIEWKASSWHLFFTVPTGRACGKENLRLSSDQIEKILKWLAEMLAKGVEIPIKVTCAPQFSRILTQRGVSEFKTRGRSCMAGNGFVFVSSTGDVKPCGYFNLIAGNVRKQPFDEIYLHSEVFENLRNASLLEGKCGMCSYKEICGGCRAKAYATGSGIFGPDPDCLWSESIHITQKVEDFS
ncbi:MAG: radical SAM protein [Candidatus Riflebacteria bacterium]|nr:radical SAM protein [Candidatus Riflebacteria bacterium]